MRIFFLIILCFFQAASGVLLTQAQINTLQTLDAQQKKKEHKSFKQNIAKKLMQQTPLVQGYDYLITWHEWQELAIADYIALFDRSRTAFGTWGLEQLSKPITDIEIIRDRQAGIAVLEKNSELIYDFYRLLSFVSEEEGALLAYYDEHDELSRKAQSLYYNCFKSMLNKSKFALDYAYLADVSTHVGTLASLLCLNGLMLEAVQAQLEGRQMHIVDGLYKGCAHLATSHNPSDAQYQQYKQGGKFDVPEGVHEQSDCSSGTGLLSYCGRFMDKLNHGYNWFLSRATNPATVEMVTRGSFGDKWSFYKEQCQFPSIVALLWVTGQVAYNDYAFYTRIQQTYDHLLFLYKTHVNLQHRLVEVAQLYKHVNELVMLAQQIPALRDHNAIKQAYTLINGSDHGAKLEELFLQLSSSTYDEKKQLFYSRGQVLLTHSLLAEIKSEFVPLLQAVGIIDGYISICSMYKEHKVHAKKPFCFVEFVETEQSLYSISDGWLPLIKNEHIYNSCALGSSHVQNMLLTGPNGGGKSSLLKLVGGSAVLAQSWGIVPARSCVMNCLVGLRTSFNPQEDIKRGISTFMAQKEQLGKITAYVSDHKNSGPVMVLIDEPYRGTIEAEAEKRADALARDLAQYPHCMVIMASHLQKPLELEQTGMYKNMQFQIEDDALGGFIRTFKLADGAAYWWFDDIERRMRFIDWLHTSHSAECS